MILWQNLCKIFFLHFNQNTTLNTASLSVNLKDLNFSSFKNELVYSSKGISFLLQEWISQVLSFGSQFEGFLITFS